MHGQTDKNWSANKLIRFGDDLLRGGAAVQGYSTPQGELHMEPMDFRKFAEDCVRLAERIQSVEDKSVLLSMAQAWIRLADQGHEVYRLIGENDPQPP